MKASKRLLGVAVTLIVAKEPPLMCKIGHEVDSKRTAGGIICSRLKNEDGNNMRRNDIFKH